MDDNAIASRGPLSEQAELRHYSDRLPPGVSSGTLDAIRERMRSIQLAAAAGNPESVNRPFMHTNAGSVDDHHASSDHSTVDNPPPPHGVLPMDEKALSGLQARMERLKSGSMEF